MGCLRSPLAIGAASTRGDGFRAGNTRRVGRLHVHDALLERGLEFGPNERTHRRIADGILAAAAVSSVFSHYEAPMLTAKTLRCNN
jgi:hypothetical protein